MIERELISAPLEREEQQRLVQLLAEVLAHAAPSPGIQAKRMQMRELLGWSRQQHPYPPGTGDMTSAWQMLLTTALGTGVDDEHPAWCGSRRNHVAHEVFGGFECPGVPVPSGFDLATGRAAQDDWLKD